MQFRIPFLALIFGGTGGMNDRGIQDCAFSASLLSPAASGSHPQGSAQRCGALPGDGKSGGSWSHRGTSLPSYRSLLNGGSRAYRSTSLPSRDLNTRSVNHCCSRWIRSITSNGMGGLHFIQEALATRLLFGVDLLLVCAAQLKKQSHPVQSQFENLSDFSGFSGVP